MIPTHFQKRKHHCNSHRNPGEIAPWSPNLCLSREALGNITPDNCVGQVRILRVWSLGTSRVVDDDRPLDYE